MKWMLNMYSIHMNEKMKYNKMVFQQSKQKSLPQVVIWGTALMLLAPCCDTVCYLVLEFAANSARLMLQFIY